MSKKTKVRRGWLPYAIAGIATLVIGGAIGGLVVFSMLKQPSGSMLPTLAIGQTLVVNKLDRGGAAGEVIVFRFPENPSQLFSKRVIARPGETLEVIDGRPVVNGKLVPSCFIGKIDTAQVKGYLSMERLADQTYLVLFDDPPRATSCTADADCKGAQVCRAGMCGLLQGPFIAKGEEVWVMGDNRNNSHDSRSWNGGSGGGVPLDNIVGRVMVDSTPVLPEGATGLDEKLHACRDQLTAGG